MLTLPTGRAPRRVGRAILLVALGLLSARASDSHLVQHFATPELRATIDTTDTTDTTSDIDWTQARWLVPGRRDIWVVDVGSRLVRVYANPRESVMTATEEGTGSTQTTQVLRRTVFEQTATWAWPEPLYSSRLSATDLQGVTVAPFDEDSAWLVDSARRRAWLLEEGEWRGSIIFGEPVASVTALPGGGLVIDTPEAPNHAHALLSPSGEVSSRFGQRLEPLRGALDHRFNLWVLATSRDGDILAAHRHLPLLRRYDRRGKLKWERALEVPGLDSLESAKARIEELLEVNDKGCLICRMTVFATAVTETRDREIAVSFSGQAALQLYSDTGHSSASAAVGQSDHWPQAGFALGESWLVALEPRGLFTYLAGEERLRIEGEVRNADFDRPIAGATIGMLLQGGTWHQVTTDADGRFRVPEALPASARAEITIDATGYLRLRLEGDVASLVAEPFLLESAPLVCVEVLDIETLAPIPAYDYTLIRDQRSAQAVVRTTGPSRHIETPNGLGCIAAPWRSPWLVRVEGEGYAAAEERVALRRGAAVKIFLRREARAVVTVENEDEEPIEGAEVFALAIEQGETALDRAVDRHVATTNPEGRAVLKELAPGTYEVEVTHLDFLPGKKKVQFDEGDNLVSLTLSDGARAEVLVTSKHRDTPVEGAEVRIEAPGRRGGSCSSGPDGRCPVPALAPGSHVVSARAEGFTPGLARFTIEPEQTTVEVTIQLRNGVEIDGLVLGMERYPEARFEIRVSVPRVPVVSAPISPDGRFRIAQAPSGGGASILLVEPGTRSVFAQKEMEIPAEGPVQLTLELPPRLTVSGRVTVDGRRPCGGCIVALKRVGAEVGAAVVERGVDVDGGYTAHLPGRGVYRVRIQDPASGASLSDYLKVDSSMTKNWSLSGGEIRGRVYDEHGKAVSGALLELRDGAGRRVLSMTSGSEGAFRFEGLEPGRYEVVAAADGATSRKLVEVSRAGHSEELELFLPPADPLQIRLHASDTGEPILAVAARVLGPNGEDVRVPHGVRAEDDGIIRLPAPASAPWTLVVTAPGYAILTLEGLVPGRVVDIALPRGYAFAVDVDDSISPCAILVEDRSGRPISLGVDFAPGPAPLFVNTAMFNSVPIGAYRVTIVSCDGERLSAVATISPGTSPQLQFGH